MLLIAAERPVPPAAVPVLRLGALADDVVEGILIGLLASSLPVSTPSIFSNIEKWGRWNLPSIGSCSPLIP